MGCWVGSCDGIDVACARWPERVASAKRVARHNVKAGRLPGQTGSYSETASRVRCELTTVLQTIELSLSSFRLRAIVAAASGQQSRSRQAESNYIYLARFSNLTQCTPKKTESFAQSHS